MSDNNFSGGESQSQVQTTLELMKSARRWLVWKYVPNDDPSKKKLKVPYYASGRARAGGVSLDTVADIAALVSYSEAADRLVGGGFDGLGFALGYDESLGRYWQGIDLDRMKETGLWSIANLLPSYVEYSPSGNGVHCIGLGQRFRSISGKDGVEAYASARFFTFTGRKVLRDDPPTDLTAWRVDPRIILVPEAERDVEYWDGSPEILTPDRIEQLRFAMPKYINADDYFYWINVGFALRRYGSDGRKLWDRWSAGSEKYSEARQNSEWSSMRNVRATANYIFNLMSENGCDLSDLARLGLDHKASAPATLVRVPRLDDYRSIKPIEFLLDGQIPVGSLTIAGVRGGGKTTMLVALAVIMTGSCAGLHPMKPRVCRKVIWVTEDEDQIHRIIVAMINTGEIADPELFWDRFIMIRARRSDPASLAKALGELGEVEGLLVNTFDRGEHVAQPLIILDTVAATLEIKEENSNSDVSRAVAAVRQSIPSASVWFVTHVAKGMGRTDTLREMTARGASAFESDVQGNAVLALEDDLPDKRFLILGKKRVDVDRNEITATRLRWETETSAVWGDRVEKVSYVTVEQTDQEERTEAVEEARETAAERRLEAREANGREAVLQVASEAGGRGHAGIAVRFGSGGSDGPIEGYESYERITAAALRERVRVFTGKNADKDFKAFMQNNFRKDLDNENIVFVPAPDYVVPGVAG
jgi:hypothetical protein